jgi:hypothetical protein
MRNLLLLVTITAILILNGCGGGLKTVNVTGTVTFDGEPIAGATVNFVPQGEGHIAYAITDAEGRYRLQTSLGKPGAGTTPGIYDVFFVKMQGVDQGEYVPSAESVSHVGPVVRPRSLIPEKYNSPKTSGLTRTVENKKENVFDFNLTSN